MRCGYFATAAEGKKPGAKKLVQECTRVLQGAGKDYLARFKQGRTPKPGQTLLEPVAVSRQLSGQ